ncbi:MAG: hypothetical protein GXY44_01240 [Phycisphaerales bacterium]|nr:hypothetical protein [Phycisphaerales bacterium]
MIPLLGLVVGSTMAEMVPFSQRWDVQLESAQPADILDKLDLSGTKLEAVRLAAERGDQITALTALRAYYRTRFPQPNRPPKFSTADRESANAIAKHIFQWGPYQEVDYGEDLDWEQDPAGDIEWVAGIFRFYWVPVLAKAYAATGEEKYAQAFVSLTTDWIGKYPLDNWTRAHPVYTHWRGFAWLDIQTGIRAKNLCIAFKAMVHAEAFTPEFLGLLLASLYDHQVKTQNVPMGTVHNKAIFEQRGFVNTAAAFPEFKESRSWMELGLERARENLLAQVTEDGVHREWCGGYHRSVLRDAVDIMNLLEDAGIAVPEDYRQCVRLMYDFIFGIATPDLGFPMFGDTGRPLRTTNNRSSWPLYSMLEGATKLFGDPKYAALARLDPEHLPRQMSFAWPQAGHCVMRSAWCPDQIYFALHCPAPGLSAHDSPDNGTFELYGYGRWLMTDTGFYTYGHDAEARNWHRRTNVHQTLTLDGRDSRIQGKIRLWASQPCWDAVVVENEAYPDLLHRRSVWFVDRKVLVLLDEAIGTATGSLDLHFQLAVGNATIDHERRQARTQFADANVLVWADPRAPITMEDGEGWFSGEYGSRERRKVFSYRHDSPAPARFLTVLAPFKGTQPPPVSARICGDPTIGDSQVEIDVEFSGRVWRIGRHLEREEAWCRSVEH